MCSHKILLQILLKIPIQFHILKYVTYIILQMSELLMSWLNDQVQLSRRINNFQQDFHNGYLFGELLSKYSQQLNFNEFVDKDDKASRIKNFTLLFDTFKTLRVGFDSNIAMNVIEKKQGIAMKVLYELKMQLEKTTSNAFSKMTKPNKPLSPLKKIPIPKEKFDKISKQHFNKQLNQIHQAQKNINLESHLSKFTQFQQKQTQKIDNEEKKQAQARLLGQMKFRQKQLENIKKSAQFRNDWEQSNMQKWAANIAVRKLQQDKDNMFKTKLQTTKIQNKTMSELNAIKTLDKDLKEFERKALPKRIDDSSSEDESQKGQKLQNQQPSLIKKSSSKMKANETGFGVLEGRSKLNTTGNLQQQFRKKKNPQEAEAARHQREKRRRKMIVQQSKKQQLIKIERQQKYIINTLQQTSKQQKQIQYEIWRAWQNKEVIIQNKNSYNEKLKEKQELRAMNAKFKNEQLVKTFRQEHQKELKEGIDRQNRLKTHNSVKNRKKVYDQCKQIIQKFINMTQIVYQYGQQKNQQQIDETFMAHLLDQFVQSASNKKQIAELELRNYINGKGQWNIEIKRDEGVPVEPIEQNSIPNTVVNNYYLGNILKSVFKEIYNEEEEKNKQEVQANDISNFIALLGLEFAGKSTLAENIKKSFGFNIISIPEIVQQKLQDYQTMKSRGLEIDGETAQLVQLCYSGHDIPNNFIIKLIKENVQKNEKSLIINYPTTYEECIEFTKIFGGTEPSDYTQKSKLVQKIEEFSRLVWPTETKIIPRSLKPCGLDFALWIQISPRTSLDRFLGRRWATNGNCIHINDEIENPNELIVGEKGSAVILKNNFKLKNKNKLQNWLNQFGIQIKENEQSLVQKCWESISGECSAQQLTKNVFQMLTKALYIKNTKKKEDENKENQLKQQQKKKQEKQQFELELKQKCVFTAADQIKQRFKIAMDMVKMDRKFLESIEKVWNNTEKLTINGFLNVFQAFRDQQQAKNKHISSTKRNFINMLTRQDQRFYLVKKFQNQYNKFIDDNNDMVIQDYTKQQLHQRIDDLQTDLLTLIQQKKEDAISERDSIMKSGWLESQLDQITACIHVILQIQLNRTFACQQIISDFYSKKYLVNTGEIQQNSTELGIDNDLEIIKDNGFPRLQKLISEATRIFNREQEVVDDKNKKGGKAPTKKDDKKQAKKGGKQQPQQKAEPTSQELQYKKALNTEKAIFRYRLKVIAAFAAKKLKQFQQQGLKLYADLEDLYKYTDKVENKAVIEMTKIFKRCIQEERKIENEVQIHYIDVIESQKIRNFKKPKPIILPAVEKVQSNRFTITAIQQMIKILKNESEAGVNIKSNRLIALFEQLSVNQRYRALLPENWKVLQKIQHEKFIARFDQQGRGQIQLWIIFTIIALSNCPLPNLEQIKQYQLQITNHNPLQKQVDIHRLQSTKSWFDSEQPQQQNIRFFDRNKYLKQQLFHIFKNQQTQTVTVDNFINKIALLDFIDADSRQQITYFDFAFSKQ